MTTDEFRSLLLAKLPPPIVDRAMRHIKPDCIESVELTDSNSGNAIGGYFLWSFTAEGDQFWYRVDNYWRGISDVLPSLKGVAQ